MIYIIGLRLEPEYACMWKEGKRASMCVCGAVDSHVRAPSVTRRGTIDWFPRRHRVVIFPGADHFFRQPEDVQQVRYERQYTYIYACVCTNRLIVDWLWTCSR